MTIEAKIVADSISPKGIRLTTLSLTYPRFIHAEFMTHRMFSRNASSSRAMPIEKIINQVEQNPAIPIRWGKNQKGMQAREDVDEETMNLAIGYWLEVRDAVVSYARKLAELKIHKEIVNRILEPFHHIKTVCTATDFENFYNLRIHNDAQAEIRELASKMLEAQNASNPVEVRYHEWHLPFIMQEEHKKYNLHDLIKASAARCARVSYQNHDGSNPDIEKDIILHDDLLEAMHMSPFEHQAIPALDPEKYYGNLKGWIQYRKNISGENRNSYPLLLKTK